MANGFKLLVFFVFICACGDASDLAEPDTQEQNSSQDVVEVDAVEPDAIADAAPDSSPDEAELSHDSSTEDAAREAGPDASPDLTEADERVIDENPWELDLVPDSGVRVPCATIPRIGLDDDGTFILYHNSRLVSTSGHSLARSEDGMVFGESSESETRMEGHVTWQYRRAFPDRLELPTESTMTEACAGAKWRLFFPNHTDGSPMGNAVRSRCSADGIWFTDEVGERVTPDEGSRVGVIASYQFGSMAYLLMMDGPVSDERGANQHRVWLYRSTDGTADDFELVDDDPLGNGEISRENPRHNDPVAIPLLDGDVGVVTMYSTAGDPPPPDQRVNSVYAWRVSADDPETVLGANLNESGENEPVLHVDDLDDGEHDVWSVNDPSFVQLPDGRTRMYFGAKLLLESYPDEEALQSCAFEHDGVDYAWAILSATSR